MSGWIKLHREVFDSDIWHDVTTFRLFIFLISNASHTDGLKYKGMTLNKGQYVRSYRKLADDLSYREGRGFKSYSLNTIKKCVHKLIDAERVNVEETELGTLFTIVNYAVYQGSNDDEQRSENTHIPKVRTNGELMENEVRTNGEQDQELKNLRIKELSNKDIVENKFSPDSPEYKLTKFLVSKMIQNNENARVPQTDKQLIRWIESMDKIHRLDNYTHRQIRDAIEWSQQDDFWKSNILSTAKLREKMPTLVLQMQRRQSKQKSSYQQKKDILQSLYEEAAGSESS